MRLCQDIDNTHFLSFCLWVRRPWHSWYLDQFFQDRQGLQNFNFNKIRDLVTWRAQKLVAWEKTPMTTLLYVTLKKVLYFFTLSRDHRGQALVLQEAFYSLAPLNSYFKNVKHCQRHNGPRLLSLKLWLSLQLKRIQISVLPTPWWPPPPPCAPRCHPTRPPPSQWLPIWSLNQLEHRPNSYNSVLTISWWHFHTWH